MIESKIVKTVKIFPLESFAVYSKPSSMDRIRTMFRCISSVAKPNHVGLSSIK